MKIINKQHGLYEIEVPNYSASGNWQEHFSEKEREVVSWFKERDAECILRFGSYARFIASGGTDEVPADIDLVYIGEKSPRDILKSKSSEVKDESFVDFDIWWFKPNQIRALALLLSKLPYWLSGNLIAGTDVVRRTVAYELVARQLIGEYYEWFDGLDNGEIISGYMPDLRDHSVIQVLHGNDWWDAIRLRVLAKLDRTMKKLDRCEDELSLGDFY